jgi:Ca2+-binding RTX toxin-like protein
MPKGNHITPNYTASSGDDVMVGTSSADRMNGGAGNDTMTGAQGADVFGMSVGGGYDLVTDFVTKGPNHDLVAFEGFGSFVDAGAHTALTGGETFETTDGHTMTVGDYGDDTVLYWDTGDYVVLAGVSPSQLFGDWIVSQ